MICVTILRCLSRLILQNRVPKNAKTRGSYELEGRRIPRDDMETVLLYGIWILGETFEARHPCGEAVGQLSNDQGALGTGPSVELRTNVLDAGANFVSIVVRIRLRSDSERLRVART